MRWECALAGLRAVIKCIVLMMFGSLALQSPLQASELMPVPELRAHVTDTTQTLSAEQTRALEDALLALEQRKGAQLALLMIPTLNPPADVPSAAESIESYATRAFERWKLGRKGIDDGVLLLIVKNDSRVRIEVGYGLEGAIPDVAAARIIREYVTPRFRNGDYYGAIRDAIQALTNLIDGEPLPEPLEGTRVAQPNQATTDPNPPWWLLTIGVAVVSMVGGLLVAALLQNLFNFFPIQVIPIVLRRTIGLLVGPLLLAAAYGYAPWPQNLPVLAVPQWWLAGVITGGIGWRVVAQGASTRWASGMTWSEFFSGLFAAIFWIIIDVLLSAITGGSSSSSSSRGFSGGGGSSGGGGASGRW